MVLAIARPMRRGKSGVYYLRMRIPRDVIGKARGTKLAIPVGDETAACTISPKAEAVTVSLRTSDPKEARARDAVAKAYLEEMWDSLRHGARTLSNKEIVALAGDFYRRFASLREEEPGPPEVWEAIEKLDARITRSDAIIKNVPPHPLAIRPKGATIEQWYGPLADQMLAEKGLVVDAHSRDRLVNQLAQTWPQLVERLKRNAEGDYRPDENLDRFPEWPAELRSGSGKGGAALTSLIDGWWKEGKARGLSERTNQSYRTAVKKLRRFLGHDDASRVTVDDIIRFKDHLLERGVSAKTVNDSYLAGLRAVFEWAVSNRKLEANPAKDVKVKAAKRTIHRPKGFTDEEALAILKAASGYLGSPKELPQTKAAKQWIPWICAYTGARVGEIAQLRKQDVRQVDGQYVINITPDAGAVKDKEAREIPLHPHLIELGFGKFVDGAPDGYLFVQARSREEAQGRLTALRNRIRKFIREIVDDPHVQPYHGWRHRLKTVGRDAGISDSVLDAITGHAPSSVGASYGDVSLKAKIEAIKRLPRYEV